jgi:hypothetical protein
MPLLQRKCACGGGCPRCQDELGIQTKLKISEPGDKYEQEADRMADEVMRMPEPSVQCQVEPEEEEDEMVQRRAIAPQPEPLKTHQDTADEPSVVHTVLHSAGQPLDRATRTFMETRFGYDFSQVRVHTDAKAAESTQTVNAKAYTVGHHIVFGSGQHAPATLPGKSLLAHELAHVIQQHSGRVMRYLQRDLAIEPVVSSPTVRPLTQEDIQVAIAFNQREFTDPYSLAVIRDVIGIARFPAVSDRDLAIGVAQWQASHGIAQDGRLGPVTVTYVIEELQAENNDADAALLMLEFPRGTFLDVDTSFCSCRSALTDEIRSANFFISEYQACGSDPTVTTGDQVEACISRRARARGSRLITLGTTSSSGSITVARTPGRCGPLRDRITTAHEQIHSVRTGELQQAHGRGTRAFQRAFNDASKWVQDEINSRNTDIAVAQWALGILDRICP